MLNHVSSLSISLAFSARLLCHFLCISGTLSCWIFDTKDSFLHCNESDFCSSINSQLLQHLKCYILKATYPSMLA